MMILHMEPEQVREIVILLQNFAELILNEADNVSGATGGLAGSWNGPHSGRILNQLHGVVSSLNELAYEAIELSVLLEEEADEWETADMEGASNLNGLGFIPGLYVVPPPAPPPPTDGPSLPAPAPPEAPQLPPPSPDPTPSPPPSGDPSPPPAASIPPPVAAPVPVVGAIAGTAAVTGSTAATSYFDSPYWKERTAELERLNEEIEQLEAQDNLSPEETARLEELRQQRDRLQHTMDEGIFSQGLSPDKNPFPDGECTWYATSRRNLYPAVYGHAKYWASQASASGFEVGEMPVKGSIMVWQPGVHKAHATYGHVAYVENVEQLSDGTFRIYYTDNNHMDPSSPRSMILRLGEAGIDFIYGQVS